MVKKNAKPTIVKLNQQKNSHIVVKPYIPKFEDLWNNHPKILNITACKEKNPVTNKLAYANQCAISLSYSFEKCNINFKSLEGNKCKCGYIRGAEA